MPPHLLEMLNPVTKGPNQPCLPLVMQPFQRMSWGFSRGLVLAGGVGTFVPGGVVVEVKEKEGIIVVALMGGVLRFNIDFNGGMK